MSIAVDQPDHSKERQRPQEPQAIIYIRINGSEFDLCHQQLSQLCSLMQHHRHGHPAAKHEACTQRGCSTPSVSLVNQMGLIGSPYQLNQV